MPERDVRAYAAYFAQHGTPQERAELYAAQQAYLTVASMGGYKGNVSDFLLRPAADTAAAAETPEQAADAAEDAGDWRDNPLFAGFPETG